jgi:hypothetical protein
VSEYEQHRASRTADMRQLGNDLKLIRARVLADHTGFHPAGETWSNVVNAAYLRMQPEIIEARYRPNGPKFSNIFAQVSLDCYLDEASKAQHAA